VKGPEVKADRTIMTPRGIAYRPAETSDRYLIAEIKSSGTRLMPRA
jgi:hypothetical protein